MKIDDDSLYDVAFGDADAETFAAVEAEATDNPELAERLADLKAIVASARAFEENDFDRRFGEIDLIQDFADICAAIEGTGADEAAEGESTPNADRSAQIWNACKAFEKAQTPNARDAIVAEDALDASTAGPSAAESRRTTRKDSVWTRPSASSEGTARAVNRAGDRADSSATVRSGSSGGDFGLARGGQTSTLGVALPNSVRTPSKNDDSDGSKKKNNDEPK